MCLAADGELRTAVHHRVIYLSGYPSGNRLARPKDPFLAGVFCYTGLKMQRDTYFEQLFNDWQASNKTINEFLQDIDIDDALHHMHSRQAPPPKQELPKWNNLAEMNAYLRAHPPKPRPKPKSPAQRKLEIERELDIIRGRVPTPKGYKIDPRKIKSLMQEYRSL